MFKRFISYYKPYKVGFTFDMLASLMIALIGMGYPILTNTILRRIVPDSTLANDEKTRFILILGASLFVCYFIRMLLRYFVQYYGHVIGVHMQADMRRDMFKKLQKLPFSYYDEHETGKIMSRMTNDLMEVSELAHHGPENFFISGVSIVLSLTYLFFINWQFTLGILACVPLLIIITLVMRKKMTRAFTESRKNVAQINASLESSITGIRVTKAFNNAQEEYNKFEVGNNDFVKSRSVAYNAMGKFFSSTTFVTDIFNVILLVVGGILTINGKLDLAEYTTFVISVALFITPLTTLINFVEQYQNGVTGFKRFIEIMDEKEEAVNPNAKDIERLEGNIKFENVYFEYTNKNADTIEQKKVLNDVSFEIQKGQKVALVGSSGGGKTTICNLIPNFYKINSGKILLDDINIDDITFASLRDNIGVVAQDVFLFNGTIKENILYGKLDATQEEVITAAKLANIDEYINTLDNGYDTIVGERGVRLSGGQKQRIAIARVFLKNPPILILDEATSALDNTTEIEIQKSLDKLCEQRTTLVVAHRLSTIRNADKIFVVEDGKIMENGSHDELLKLNGKYATLYKAQIKE